MEGSHAETPARRAAAGLQQRYRMFVDGQFVEGGGEPLRTINPATEEVLTGVSTASTSDVDTAVRAAGRAYDKVWSRMPGPERARYLFRIARLVAQRAEGLAALESLDTGTPLVSSREVSVPAAAAHVFYHAGWADKLGYAGYGPDPRPLGVAGQVTGSEAALLSAIWRVAPALSCGNTVVLKPAGTTPLTALTLAEICQQADLPPGVLNVLPGGADVGAALLGHDGLGKAAFTGPAEVGRQIQRALAGTGRRLTLSLRGTATTVVFEDAPLDEAVGGIIDGAVTGTWPGSRLLVQEPVAEQLLAMLRARLAELRVGDPQDPDTDVGAIASRHRLERLRELTDGAASHGARCWTSPSALPARGFFCSPTLVSAVSPAMRIAREEAGGPVLVVLTFRTPDEAVTLVNTTPAGLSVSIWTGRGSRLLWAAQRMRTGVVWANTRQRVDPTAAFGGYREAGSGRDGGRAGLAEYLDV